MKIKRGILAYVLLIVSGAYLNMPIFALLAIPVFIAGTIIAISFYLTALGPEKPGSWLPISLIMFGTLILCGTAAYAAIDYTATYILDFEYLADRSSVSAWPFAGIVTGLILVSSTLIFFGLKRGSLQSPKQNFLIWIPTILLIPFIILMTEFFVWIGIAIG